MKSKFKLWTLVMVTASLPLMPGFSLATDTNAGSQGDGTSLGKALFEQHCAVCHPNGGNIINPDKPLDKASLAENGIKNPADIIEKMRNPGPGMTPFHTGIIPDEAAKDLAEYILKTY